MAGTKVTDENNEDGYYHYESIKYKSYSVGDTVSYNNVNYYVIANSDTSKDTVTLLKAEPLTVDEVNRYGGVGTANNHVNRYTVVSARKATDVYGYGGMAYYTSDECGRVNNSYIYTRCTTNYQDSDIKYVVDAWAQANANSNDLIADSTGYKARLITEGEYSQIVSDIFWNSKYWYWTMSSFDSSTVVWCVNNGGLLDHNYINSNNTVVLPVIIISKSAL